MIRAYAYFSKEHPFIHKFNILFVFSIFIFCTYQLLENSKIKYSLGFVLVIFSVFIFAKASTYKSKYLSDR
ncbi:hypothetical protein C0W92_08690 [Photobacterium angustum]|uniref:Uncharacterized protein n=1 Tax=Photobacterium angustum TaxID=661 RepID=A0A2T3M3C2_PHOAN|nr:hypothetical protein CTM95_00655 [Photobacterium angustum]PSW78673.1 hypothetical protein CTN03_18550 [Photobacterium angustum]PSW90104.1 hypothetical protein C0W92_08690 [Photobacterium angustum]PSW96692.1 hypothetical protein C0W79_00035 [Photobacterium angustum]PSX03903.1 hypothetical protein C0W87_04200 [Photobacterium angustum]